MRRVTEVALLAFTDEARVEISIEGVFYERGSDMIS
jgi:hypothetical protein